MKRYRGMLIGCGPLKCSVKGMLSDSPIFQADLIATLAQARTGVEKEELLKLSRQIRENAVYAESRRGPVASATSSSTAAPAKDTTLGLLKNWDLDVFLCDGAGSEEKKIASSIVDAARATKQFDRVRPRILSRELNALPSYGFHGFVISHSADEHKEATALKDWLASNGLGNFQLRLVSQRTPYYMGAFVCTTTTGQ